ncbi:MAG TPA: hypothetical protein VD758_06120 [Gemmatimonadaceae bacterium]|nr:hypothetical protein [Gemmatimonadaceae bacterium]
MTKSSYLRGIFAGLTLTAATAACARAQRSATSSDTSQTPGMVMGAESAMGSMTMTAADVKAMNEHMEMTSLQPSNPADSIRAARLVTQLRSSIAKYKDVDVAVNDGFKQFAPQVKNQHVYHFTNYRWALENAFRFNPEKPTSLLYKKDADGKFVLVGAMYTAPKRASEQDLDKRVPLSVAQWHKHVNWCLPPRGADESAWQTRKNGRPVFGPLGVSTEAECDAAGGRFEKEVFGWMVHANVYASDDPKVIWHDDHGMSGNEMMDHDHD